MQVAPIGLFVGLLALLSAATASYTLQFAKVNGQTGHFICCETYAPNQTLFFCVINNQPNFESFTVGGQVYQFTPAKGLGVVEQRVAAVQPSPTTPFPLGGWNLGDIFIGSEAGTVVKIVSATKIINPWITLPETLAARQTVFDRTGTVYGGDLIVSFTYSAYRVQSNGTYQRLFYNGGLHNYEGLDIVPVNSAFGALSGTILIPQNPDDSNPYNWAWRATTIVAVNQQGSAVAYETGCYCDQVFFVHDYDNFFGCDRDSGNVYSSTWDHIQEAGLDQTIVMMCEQDAYPGYSGLRNLYSSSGTVSQQPIYWAGESSGFGGHWEHGCFSRGGSANVLPGGFSFCFYVSEEGTAPTYDMLGSYSSGTYTILQEYGVNGVQSSYTYAGEGGPKAVAGSMVISIIQDVQNGFYLQIVSSASGSSSLDLGLTFTGAQDPNMLIRVQNNPSDYYYWDTTSGTGRFTWSTWSSGTRGLVLGPVSAIVALQPFSFTFTVYSATGINKAQIASDAVSTNTILNFVGTASPLLNFAIHRISCKCGDGQAGDDPVLKQCDPNAANSPCCTKDCQLQPTSVLCNSSTNVCISPSYCTGTSATCPPMQNASICNCQAPYYGPNCTHVRCDLETTCGTCNKYTQCEWCCDTNSCVQNGSCSNPYPRSCPACTTGTCSNGGTCNCGGCVCPPGYGGALCDETYDCFGNLIPSGGYVAKIDICGVCNGTGTSCIGCDGVPFGAHYDACGVCGGNGASCYNPCPGTTCDACDAADGCVWCGSSQTCHPTGYNCTGGVATSCVPAPAITPAEIAGTAIGTAALIGIIIGVIVALILAGVGGKKGYDAWVKSRGKLDAAQANPMYQDKGLKGDSPFYEPPRATRM